MATLREYFDTDFRQSLTVSNEITITKHDLSANLKVIVNVHFNFDSNTKYLSFYLPENNFGIAAIIDLIQNKDLALSIGNAVQIKSGLPGESMLDSNDLQFSGRMFFYGETNLDSEQFEKLKEEAKQKNIYIQFRGPEFAVRRSAIEKPLAFISHDSRDKDAIARPIAIGLSKLMCPVWFDEYSLKVGDRLRESIEKGIKECKKCILVLSPNFIANTGWTKVEFNSIFTRELIEESDIVLPVWHGIDKKQIYEYCPSLVNKVGVKTDVGIEEVIRKLHHSIPK